VRKRCVSLRCSTRLVVQPTERFLRAFRIITACICFPGHARAKTGQNIGTIMSRFGGPAGSSVVISLTQLSLRLISLLFHFRSRLRRNAWASLRGGHAQRTVPKHPRISPALPRSLPETVLCRLIPKHGLFPAELLCVGCSFSTAARTTLGQVHAAEFHERHHRQKDSHVHGWCHAV